MQGRVKTLTTFRTGDDVIDRNLDHIKQTLNPVLGNTLLTAVDFRWTEIQGADSSKAPSFALQYRSTGTTWTTIGTFTSSGDLSTAISQDLLTSVGDLVYASAKSTAARLGAGANGQLLALAAGLPAWQGETAWTAPTLLNSWVNFGGSHLTAGYMKDAQGFVHLRGLVRSGTIPAAIFTLPAGYRPSGSANYAVVCGGASDQFGSVFIDSSGNVQANAGANAYFSLDGITFDTR